jgi:hypothetical protein
MHTNSVPWRHEEVTLMPFDLTRRQSLLAACAVTCAAWQPGASLAAASDDLLGGGRYQEVRDGPLRFSISRVQPATGKVRLIDVPFFPHGLTAHPLDRHRIFAFEKMGIGAGVVDLATMRWLTAIAPVSNRRFYGHGACSPDGEFLYSTETDAQGIGVMGVREAASLRYVGDFPSFGANPHDCTLIEGGRVMVIANGGGDGASTQTPCISYVDVRTRKLLEKSDMLDVRFNTGHLFPMVGRESVVVSAPRLGLGVEHPGAISRQRPNQALAVFKTPEPVTQSLLGEALSVVALPSKDLLIVTHPTPGLLTFWHLDSGAYIKSLPLAHARGIVQGVDEHTLWISHGAAASLAALSLATLELLPHARMDNTFLGGSHLFNHALMP